MKQIPKSEGVVGVSPEEASRQAYEEYVANFQPDTYTVTYGDQSYTYSADEINKIKTAYSYMNADEAYSKKAYESYTNSDFDQYAMQNGLPSWKMWGDVEKYASGGGLKDNYGNVSAEQWKKINELWSKDWEYGLTDADAYRQANGLPPVSYDSMYGDTLLDAELKANGLPPSKLLNGELGDKYRAWASDSAKWTEFMDAVERRFIEKTGALNADYNPLDFSGNLTRMTYTLDDALNETLADPQWAEFANAHYGVRVDVPDQYSDAYIMTEKDEFGNKYEVRDENGGYVYDTAAWNKDREKATKNNLAIDSDEFAITSDRMHDYHAENGQQMMALMAAEKSFAEQGKTLNASNAQEFSNLWSDYYTGFSLNEGEGYTVDLLFPDANLSEEEREEIQPFINKANRIRIEQGYEASREYLVGGEFSRELKQMNDDKIVAHYRNLGNTVEGSKYSAYKENPMKDEEILHEHYTSIGEPLGMTQDEILAMERGELSLSDYMREKCPDVESAEAFVNDRLTKELTDLNIPLTVEELHEKHSEAYAVVDNYLKQHEVGAYIGSMGEVEALGHTRSEVIDRILCSEEECDKYYKEQREWYNGLPFKDPKEREKYLGYLQKEEDAVRGFREQIRKIQPDFYDKVDTYPPYNLAYAEGKINKIHDKRVSMLVDAISYTPEFAEKTADMDYVNQRFDQIIAEDAKSSADLSDVVVYATDDEKRKLVFMSEQNPEDADTYLNKILLHQWDNMTREDKRANTEMIDGGVIATIGSIIANPFESVYNFFADGIELIKGNEILSSQRATWSTDVQSRIAENISESWAGDVGAFLYQLIPSTVQSGASMWLAMHTGGASEAFTLALMSTESYSSAVDQALQNGASSGEAFLIGLANGANEALFEHLSLESFLKQGNINTIVGEILASGNDLTNATVRKTFAKELGKRMLFHGLVEGSEELNTSLANLFAESLILGVNSSYNKSVERYVQAGLSREEAENRATEDVVKGVAMDFVGGLVSGAFMTVGNDLVDSRGGRVFIDRTGMTNFVSQTHNLSLVKTEDALDYAKKHLEKDANGLVTVDSAQRVFDDLRKQGADAATLSRVRDSFSTAEQITANQGAQAVAQTAIREQRNEDGKKLVKAASQMIYNKVQNGKGTIKVSEAEIARVTNEYLDRLTGTVQAGDIRNIELASEAMRLGYIDDIKGLAGYDTIAGGMNSIAEYYNTLSAEDQTAIKESAKKYINTYNHAGLNGEQAGRYANAAAILEHAVSNADALNGLNSVFGSAASVSPQAVANACLNEDAKASMAYVIACCRALSVLKSQSGSHLFSAAQNNTDATAYVASQMALAASMPTDTSYARAMYDYVSKYGATPETMDLLTAANICESIGTEQTDIRRKNGKLYTTEQIAQITREYNKALTNYNNKKAIAQAHEQADATERTEHEARIEKYRAQITELQTMMDGADSATLEALAGRFANATAEFQNAQGALETLIANQNQRNTQTQADLASAESAYNDAKEKYQNAMQEHAANYTQRMGDILEAIKGKQKVSLAALRQANALVMYGTEENLNDVQQKIIAAEKTAAVALGRALGADVQCVKFDEAFLTERKIPKSKWEESKTSRGMRQGGTIYLNESVMKPEVGSLTNEVLLHEIGHFLEESADNYNNYKEFAKDYYTKKYGEETVKNIIENEGEDELVAEFTRQVALADPRAVAALCKSAPKMSMRVFQWLTATNNRMSSVAVSQSKIVRDAQRAFASGIKAVRANNANQTETSAEDATRGSAMRNAEKVMNDVVQYDAQNAKTNTEQDVETETVKEATIPADAAETEVNDFVDERVAIEEVEIENPTNETTESVPVTLPFELPEKAQSLIDNFVESKASHAVDGKVSPDTNETIRNLVKNQVAKAATAIGVTLDAETIDAYAEQYTLPEFETSGESWINGYKPTETKTRVSTDFADIINSTAMSDAQFYTEIDTDAYAVQNTIENMTADEKRMNGDPRLIQTNHGFVVARKVSREGLVTGNPVFNKGETPVAMIAPVSEFPNGDVGKLVPLSKCTSLVVPNTYAYAETRTDAREMGVNVYPYNSEDPTAFDRAINRAAQQSNVQFMTNETIDDWIEKYGAKKPGAEPRVENRPVPERTSDTNRVSDMVRNAAEAPVTTDSGYSEIRNWITNRTGTYTPISNAKTLEKARGTIERAGSINQAAADLHRDVANSNGKATDLLARAELLYVEAQNPASGLTELEREEIFGDMCIIASDAGRALQAASLLKNMTAEGHIQYIEQVGKRMSDRYQKRTKERVNLKLTEEEKERYRTAVTEEQRKQIDDEVGKRFAEETSKLTFLDKIRNWRYFSMLGNPRTHFRNIVGNSLMRPVARIKDTINAGLQAAFGVEQADRTTSAWTGRVDAATRAYVEDQLRQALPIMQGVSSKYADEVTKTPTESNDGSLKATLTQEVPTARLSNGKTRLGRFLNTLSFINSNALELEDARALGHRFRSSMYQIIKARGLDVNNISDEQRDSIVNYAMEESLRATFRDANALADAINKFARTNRATQFLTEAIIPFKKTPLNIAKRSIEYSPIGLVNGIYKLCSNTPTYNAEIKRIDAMRNVSDAEKAQMKQDAANTAKMQKIAAIDRLSQGLTGSLLTALGLFASKMGWISIGRKDDEEAAFEQGLGKNTYSLNIGDLSIDLSAFAPSAVPMLMGSALYEAFGADRGDGGAFVSDLISVLCESVDPVTEMSMLSGLADAFQGLSYSGNEDGGKTRYIGTVIGNAMSSYIGQFIPTFVGQIARVTDPYARSYSAGDDYWASSVFGSEVGSVVKSMQNKIPFLSWLSEPKVDVHGNPVKNYTNWGSYIFHPLNNFILPATIKQDSKNEIDDELVRLYGVVDSADIFPTKPSRNLGAYTDKKTGQKYQFKITNDSEYTQYQMDVGQTVYDMLEDLMQSRAYARMTDEQKAEAIAKVIDQAQSSVKKRWKAQKIAAIGK